MGQIIKRSNRKKFSAGTYYYEVTYLPPISEKDLITELHGANNHYGGRVEIKEHHSNGTITALVYVYTD